MLAAFSHAETFGGYFIGSLKGCLSLLLPQKRITYPPRYAFCTSPLSRSSLLAPLMEMVPFSITYARAATESAICAFCSTSKMEVPEALISRMMRKISCTRRGERPMEGSSSSKIRGLPMSARPMTSICCSHNRQRTKERRCAEPRSTPLFI